MRVAIELSLYPLDENYGEAVIDYIERLRAYDNVEIVTNRMSTQLLGEYDWLMDIIKRETKLTFEREKAVALVMKAVNVVI